MDHKDIAAALSSIHDMTPDLWPMVESACETARKHGFRILGPEHLLHAFLDHPALARMIGSVGGSPDAVRVSLETAFHHHGMITGPVSDIEAVAAPLMLLSRDLSDMAEEDPGRDQGTVVMDLLTGILGTADGSAIAETALSAGNAHVLLREHEDTSFFESAFDYLDFAPPSAPRASITSAAPQEGAYPGFETALLAPDTEEALPAADPGPDPLDELFLDKAGRSWGDLAGRSSEPQAKPESPAPRAPEPAAAKTPRPAEKGDEVAEAVSAALRDLGAAAVQGALDPCVGRDAEIDLILSALRRRRKGSVLLYGEAGVGKSAIAEGLAQRLRASDIERDLASRPFYELSMSDMVAGTKFRGDFEARMKHLIERLREERAIVFIDEIHMLVGSGTTYGRGMDGANLFKPAMARGEVTIIGATTPSEMRLLRHDAALMRRFEPIAVREPTRSEVEVILERSCWTYLDHHGLEIEDGVIAEICRITDLYQPERHFPDKAFDLLDASCVLARELAAVPRMQLATPRLGLIHVRAAARSMGLRRPSRPEPAVAARLAALPDRLGAEIRGQTEAVQALSDAAVTASLNLDPSGPRMSALLTGTQGAGKSALVGAFANAMGLPLVRIDMRSCQERSGLVQLIGHPGGNPAADRAGLLVEAGDTHKDMVLLLKDIHHADAAILDLVAGIIRTGVFRAADGRSISLRGAWIFMTMGTGSGEEGRFGFGAGPDPAALAEEAARKALPAAMIEALSCRLHLGQIGQGDLEGILRRSLETIARRCAEFGTTLSCPDEAIAVMLSGCRTGKEAAGRAEAMIGPQLSRALLTSVDGGVIDVSVGPEGSILVRAREAAGGH